MKCIFALLLCLLVAPSVLGLQCLITDLEKFKVGQDEVATMSCLDHMRAVLSKVHKTSLANYLDSDNLRCHKVTYESVGGEQKTIRGCIPKGGCKTVKAKMLETGILAQCTECNESTCNN